MRRRGTARRRPHGRAVDVGLRSCALTCATRLSPADACAGHAPRGAVSSLRRRGDDPRAAIRATPPLPYPTFAHHARFSFLPTNVHTHTRKQTPVDLTSPRVTGSAYRPVRRCRPGRVTSKDVLLIPEKITKPGGRRDRLHALVKHLFGETAAH